MPTALISPEQPRMSSLVSAPSDDPDASISTPFNGKNLNKPSSNINPNIRLNDLLCAPPPDIADRLPEFVGNEDRHGSFGVFNIENRGLWSALMEVGVLLDDPHSDAELDSSELVQLSAVNYQPDAGLSHQPAAGPSLRPHQPVSLLPMLGDDLPLPVGNKDYHQVAQSRAPSNVSYLLPRPYCILLVCTESMK
ncbi:hypothetical protein RSAG8_03981, partial [Rhizoctonia solani AG-8 WAC10335]